MTVLDAQLPVVIGLDDFGSYAALSASLVITLFVAGLGAGWVVRMMKG